MAVLAQLELASIEPTSPIPAGLLPGMEDMAEAQAHSTPGQRMRFVGVDSHPQSSHLLEGVYLAAAYWCSHQLEVACQRTWCLCWPLVLRGCKDNVGIDLQTPGLIKIKQCTLQ